MKNKILLVITVCVVIVTVCMLIFSSDSENDSKVENSNINKAKEINARLNESGDIEINVNDLDISNVTIIKYRLDDKEMELLAVKDDSNNIRVSFNTCQVCNGSPRAYFLQKNNKLVCQNCNNTFSLKTIGISSSGCNPIAIKNSDFLSMENGVIISKSILEKNKDLFKNWKI